MALKRWTILMDIAADGVLANFGIESLKQLKDSAGTTVGDTDESEVIVAAQFSVDAPAGQKIPRYVFGPGAAKKSLSDCILDYLHAPKTMTEQEALIDFLRWAFREKTLHADYYGLILWGHGPELLMQPPPAPGNQSIRLYLTPVDLRVALQVVSPLPNNNKGFDLIGFDACSMSMIEVAYELRDYAQYMVASQEEVPDLSFPYDAIVPLFRKGGTDLEKLLREGVYAYVRRYEDYIDDAVTDMKPATLSALRLCDTGNLKEALRRLSCALYLAKGESGLPSMLIKARESARDFVSGLYVDLLGFAASLLSVLEAGASPNQRSYSKQSPDPTDPDYWKYPIRQACKDIIAALEEDTQGKKNLLVLAKCSTDGTCNGVSLYMPYLSNDQWVGISRPMIKGGDGSAGRKDFSSVLNEASPQQLLCERRKLIEETEQYYEALQLSEDTGWYRFIVEQWTRILVTIAAKNLDVLYSAEQAALNACRTEPVEVKPPCP
jgi:Clostripain family